MRKKQGFTLMEMLIVIAIIVILVAIAIPVFSAKMENVREKADLADAKNIETALKAYYLTTAGDDNLTSKNKVFVNCKCKLDTPGRMVARVHAA